MWWIIALTVIAALVAIALALIFHKRMPAHDSDQEIRDARDSIKRDSDEALAARFNRLAKKKEDER